MASAAVVDWTGLLVQLEGVGTLAIVLLTAMLWWLERHRTRAVIQIGETTSREHWRRAQNRLGGHAIDSRDPGRGIWFLLSNRGGVDSIVDMSRSYVLLERLTAPAERTAGWIVRLPRYWQDRVKLRRRRIGWLPAFAAALQPQRWQIIPIAVYTQQQWLDMEVRQMSGVDVALNVIEEAERRKGWDITLKSGASQAYVAEYSQMEQGLPRARRGILVVRPLVGSPARMRFLHHELTD